MTPRHGNLLSAAAAANVQRLAAVLLFSLGLLFSPGAMAQKWQDLKPDEQKVLAPLQADWGTLSDVRKKKWREIAAKYPTMPPDQQQKLHDRMAGWAKLTPDERRKAREQYNELKTLPAEKRAAVPQKWDEYRNLPPEKRDELRKKAAEQPKPAVPARSASPSRPAPPHSWCSPSRWCSRRSTGPSASGSARRCGTSARRRRITAGPLRFVPRSSSVSARYRRRSAWAPWRCCA